MNYLTLTIFLNSRKLHNLELGYSLAPLQNTVPSYQMVPIFSVKMELQLGHSPFRTRLQLGSSLLPTIISLLGPSRILMEEGEISPTLMWIGTVPFTTYRLAPCRSNVGSIFTLFTTARKLESQMAFGSVCFNVLPRLTGTILAAAVEQVSILGGGESVP
jgi:hypothetical protein